MRARATPLHPPRAHPDDFGVRREARRSRRVRRHRVGRGPSRRSCGGGPPPLLLLLLEVVKGQAATDTRAHGGACGGGHRNKDAGQMSHRQSTGITSAAVRARARSVCRGLANEKGRESGRGRAACDGESQKKQNVTGVTGQRISCSFANACSEKRRQHESTRS